MNLQVSNAVQLAPAPTPFLRGHLAWAEALVRGVAPKDNVYGAGAPRLSWAGVDGASKYAARSVCNTLFALLLQRAYGLTDADLRRQYGARWPRAPRIVEAIEAGLWFRHIRDVRDIRLGDVIAIRYPEGSAASGHVAIVRSPPLTMKQLWPVIPGTLQFALPIVDSTRSPHGGGDTRVVAGVRRGGVGFGTMRLYADLGGRIRGHAWSPAPVAPYRAEPEYRIAVGRLVL